MVVVTSCRNRISLIAIMSFASRIFSYFPYPVNRYPITLSPAWSHPVFMSLMTGDAAAEGENVPLYRAEGLFAVAKPIEWTSSNVVSYIRGILERDARNRGASPGKVGSRRSKGRAIKVGHGGTLDPLATGVLVIGVGSGTKLLQSYLSGPKRYKAVGELGFETSTLDMEGNVTKRAPYGHVTPERLEEAIACFTGKIQQVPPLFSAIRKDGKKLYQAARKGAKVEDLEIEAREVQIYSINVTDIDVPRFTIDVECGGGTYIRSLIRDIGYQVDSVATTALLERTQQGQFAIKGALVKEQWNADNIYSLLSDFNKGTNGSQ